MSNTNAVVPFLGGTLPEALESLGVTQFPSGTAWFQTIAGLLVQGDFLSITSGTVQTISFHAAFPKQVLGVWIQTVGGSHNNAHIDNVTLEEFELHNGGSARSYYWWALGV